MTFYQCVTCKAVFPTVVQGRFHLKIRHDIQPLSSSSSQQGQPLSNGDVSSHPTLNDDDGNGRFLVSLDLPTLNVKLQRLGLDDDERASSAVRPVPELPSVNKKKRRPFGAKRKGRHQKQKVAKSLVSKRMIPASPLLSTLEVTRPVAAPVTKRKGRKPREEAMLLSGLSEIDREDIISQLIGRGGGGGRLSTGRRKRNGYRNDEKVVGSQQSSVDRMAKSNSTCVKSSPTQNAPGQDKHTKSDDEQEAVRVKTELDLEPYCDQVAAVPFESNISHFCKSGTRDPSLAEAFPQIANELVKKRGRPRKDASLPREAQPKLSPQNEDPISEGSSSEEGLPSDSSDAYYELSSTKKVTTKKRKRTLNGRIKRKKMCDEPSSATGKFTELGTHEITPDANIHDLKSESHPTAASAKRKGRRGRLREETSLLRASGLTNDLICNTPYLRRRSAPLGNTVALDDDDKLDSERIALITSDNSDDNYELQSEDDSDYDFNLTTGRGTTRKRRRGYKRRKNQPNDNNVEDTTIRVKMEVDLSEPTLNEESPDTNSAGGSKKRHYTCFFCDERFHLRGLYSKHMRMNHMTENETFKCPDCKEVEEFTTLKDLGLHMRYRCRHRDRDLKPRRRKRDNVMRRKKFEEKANLLKLVPTPCPVCGKVFKSRDCYLKHELRWRGQKVHSKNVRNFPCPHCPARLLNEKTLEDHVRLHAPENPYKCKYEGCGFVFRSDFHHKLHEEVHTGIKRKVECLYCHKPVNKLATLKDHSALRHPGKPLSFKFTTVTEPPFLLTVPPGEPQQPKVKEEADIIRVNVGEIDLDSAEEDAEEGTSFVANSDEQNNVVPQHVADPRIVGPRVPTKYRNRNGNRFNCLLCGWTGRTRFLQEKHVKKYHPGEAVPPAHDETAEKTLYFICGTCGFQAENASVLGQHVDKEHAHSTKFPYQCDGCRRRFSTEERRQSHFIRVHENAGSIRCKFKRCKITFHDEKGLQAHMVDRHNPEKERLVSKCSICQKTLLDSYKLKLHMENAHDEKNAGHECGICGQLYSNPHALRRHIQSIHLQRGDPNNVETNNAVVVTVTDNKGPDDVPAAEASSPTEDQPGDVSCVKEGKVDTILGF